MKLVLLLLSLAFSCSVFSQAPNAQFTASPTSVCVGSPIQFTDQSVAGGAAISSYNWNFGNGITSTNQNPSYTYPNPGTYTVTLAIQAGNGQADAEVKTAYITIYPIPEPSFTMSGNGCTVPFSVTFNNTTVHEAGQTYTWSFGNGQTSNNQNPTNVTYNSAGNYTVTLTVLNTNTGCTKTITKPITVSNFLAGITAPLTACVGEAVVFNDNSTVGANSWQWSSTGAGNSTNQNPTFTFLTAGTYTVILISQNSSSGCTGNATHQITVLPSPTPSFTATPTAGCSPLQVNFTNTSGPGSSFVWHFGDGTTYTGQNPPTHSYAGNSSFDVSMTMTSANGCVDSITYPGMIQLSDPLAQFTATPINGCAPLDVQFTESSISPDPVNDPITTWKWIFGDGTSFTGQNPPVHTYPTGVYDVTLIIILQSGCSDTVVMTEYIEVGEIDGVNFTYTPATQCAKSDIQFTNTSVITTPHNPNDITYEWDFGDNDNSTDENPTHQYEADTGYFDVSLIIDFRGCKDTLKITDAIYIKAPISRFSPSQTLYCNPASFPVNVVVNDQSIIGKATDNVSMIWRWGDNSTTNLGNGDLHDSDKGSTSHPYTNYGSYTIKQVIYNTTTGCSDSTTALVHISETNADFTLVNDSVCKNNLVSMNSSPSTSSHPFGSFVYNMGDGTYVSGLNASHTYTTAGTYSITLVATNEVGCSDTKIFNPFTVLELPNAQVIASQIAGCAPLLVTFSNGSSSQGNGVPLSSFGWTFSDGSPAQNTSSVATNVTHTFTTEGNFNVTLVATDQFGCVSAPSSTSISITKPVANFTVDSVVCNLESFIASNQSTGFAPLTYQWQMDGTNSSTSIDLTSSFNQPNSNATQTPHQIKLITTDGNGCQHTLIKTITVATPHANLSYVIGGASQNQDGNYTCPPVFVDFEDQSQSYGDIVTWEWDFNDNGNVSSNQDPSNTYVFPGTYSTTLKITDEFGCTSDTILIDYLTIYGPSGEASWTQSTSNCGQDVLFELTNVQNATEIIWNIGDGPNVLDSMIFTHTYLNPGTYNPSVSLSDAEGCIVIYPLDPITINDNGLDALFVPSPSETDIGNSINYVDQSTTTNNPIVNWNWEFGDNSTQNNTIGGNVSYTHGEMGVFTVTLTVTDAAGCKSKYSTNVLIKADFDMPNVFTPNGDGINDVVFIYSNILDKFDMVILNRWGNVVSEQKEQSGTVFWDGKNMGGQLCHDGVYFYQFAGTLKGSDTVVKKEGFITLIGSKP